MVLLTDLPREVLDNVYSFLDWDRAKHVHPDRSDILSVSLTCRTLRQSILPLVFRDVVLRLMWAGGGLVEPALFRLRRDHPHLARHIRCVGIAVRFGHYVLSQDDEDLGWLSVPRNTDDWLNPGTPDISTSESSHELANYHRHRGEVDNLMQKFYRAYENDPGIPSFNDLPTEQFLREAIGSHLFIRDDPPSTQRREYVPLSSEQSKELGSDDFPKSLKLQLEALAVGMLISIFFNQVNPRLTVSTVMLCIPSTTNTLIYRSLPSHTSDKAQMKFGAQVVAVAMQIFHDRLRSLTMVASRIDRQAFPNVLQGPPTLDIGDDDVITEDVVGSMSNIRRLVLTPDIDGPSMGWQFQQTHYRRWFVLAPILRELDIRHVPALPDDLKRFITAFPLLSTLRLNSITLSESRDRLLARRVLPDPNLLKRGWLALVIELRRSMRDVTIHLSNLKVMHEDRRLSAPAAKWIEQVTPPGSIIDPDREDRLLIDFVSFLPLWDVEDSERGKHAEWNWAHSRAVLVDSAMSRRG